MKKIVLIFGSIAGLICVSMFFLITPTDASGNMDFESGELLGYTTMILSMSTIFFAVNQYRNKYLDGRIKFGKAFQIGLFITLIAGVIYVLGWEIYSANFAPDFAEQYIEFQKKQWSEQGMSEAEISTELESQAGMMELYKNNTPFRMAITLLEIVPVGLLISLICAGIFAKITKNKGPAEQNVSNAALDADL